MHHLFKNIKAEKALETPILADVTNPKSEYFGESFYLTHKVDIKCDIWYRCYPEYEIKGIDCLWFNENEVEIEGVDYE